jgi:hypothetical protein
MSAPYPKIAAQSKNRRSVGGCPKKPAIVAAMHWPESAYAVGGTAKRWGVANGERQIKIAGRGAGVIEEARAD